jgi:hypothetical protein
VEISKHILYRVLAMMLDAKHEMSDSRALNKLDIASRAKILSMLCEGASMRSVSRLADVSINTVSKLLEDAGRFCAGFHDAKVRNVKAKRVRLTRFGASRRRSKRTSPR